MHDRDQPTKEQLRLESLARRDALGPAARHDKSAAIAQAAASLAISPGTLVAGYLPIRSEADIRPLMAALRQEGADLSLPAVIDRTTVEFRAFTAESALVGTGFGTTGPDDSAPVVQPDVLLMPLAAFDRKGSRIGYGAGHYDRAIAVLRAQGADPRLIGIAFDCQEVASVPAQAHDVPLHAVLTESGLRRF